MTEWLTGQRPVSNWDRALHEVSKLLEVADVRLRQAEELFRERLDAVIPGAFEYRRQYALAQAAMRDLAMDVAFQYALGAVKAKPNWAEGQVLVSRLRPASPAPMPAAPAAPVSSVGPFGEDLELVAELEPQIEAFAARGDWEGLNGLLEDVIAHGEDTFTAIYLRRALVVPDPTPRGAPVVAGPPPRARAARLHSVRAGTVHPGAAQPGGAVAAAAPEPGPRRVPQPSGAGAEEQAARDRSPQHLRWLRAGGALIPRRDAGQRHWARAPPGHRPAERLRGPRRGRA